MAPIGIIQSLATTVGVLYMIKGKPTGYYYGFFAGTSLTISYFCGLYWGINGVAAVTLIFMIFLTYPAFSIPLYLINMKFGQLVIAINPYIISTLIMATGTVLLRTGMEYYKFSSQNVLFSCTIFGIIIYTSIIILNRPQALQDIQRLVFKKVLIS